ncbi:ABC transporter substrate-binding protein [Herbaspirillum lusitanum]|uniref:ABC transporter substrate-binding protein n=1 Tax=Herbaspirillum lusitanum TaxID=213312 RepID=A0ABW9AES2_9BURK
MLGSVARKHLAMLLLALGLCNAQAEPGISPGKIVLGQSVALSGGTSRSPSSYQLGAKIYFDALNAAGGVMGRRVELISMDDRFEPDQALANTRRLILEDKVFALFGYAGSATSKISLPLASQYGVPFFAPRSGNDILRRPHNRMLFTIRATHKEEFEFLLNQMMMTGQKNIAVFYEDNDYGRRDVAIVAQKLSDKGGRLLLAAPVAANSIDVGAASTELIAKQPDAVMLAATAPSSAALILAMRRGGYNGQFYGLSFIGTQALLELLGKEGSGVVISQVVPFPWRASTMLVSEYQKAMKNAASADLNFASLEGYIAAKIFTEGLRRAGRNLTRARLITALESIHSSNYDPGGMGINFSAANHHGSQYIDMITISRTGQFLN